MRWAPADAGRIQLRGVAQVALSPSAWTGLLFTVALFAGGWRAGVFGLLGAAASTLAAVVLGADRDGVSQGLEGYCGCLTGVAVVSRLGVSWHTALLAVLAGAVCAVVGAAAGRLLGRLGLPVLTAPFCVVAGVLAVALPTAPATAAPWEPRPEFTSLSAAQLGRAFCDNIGQVFLLDRWYAGLILLVGLLVASRKAAVAAACGSVAAILTACVMGLPADRIGQGLYGYNAVLVALALGATFLTPHRGAPDTPPWPPWPRSPSRPPGWRSPSPSADPLHLAVRRDDLALPRGRSALDRPGISFEKAK
ncbi:urea transporter [Streptomyces mexicanus]